MECGKTPNPCGIRNRSHFGASQLRLAAALLTVLLLMPAKRLVNVKIAWGDKSKKRLVNSPGDQADMADILHSVRATVYRRAAMSAILWESDEVIDDEIKFQRTLQKKKTMHWKAHPLSECWKERCATVRLGLAGKETYVDRAKL